MGKFKKTVCAQCGRVFEFGNGFFDKRPESGGFLGFKEICFNCSEKNNKNKLKIQKEKNLQKNKKEDYSENESSLDLSFSKSEQFISLVFCTLILLILIYAWNNTSGIIYAASIMLFIFIMTITSLVMISQSSFSFYTSVIFIYLIARYWEFLPLA
jgi:K+-sensing histidine kinase KdpD